MEWPDNLDDEVDEAPGPTASYAGFPLRDSELYLLDELKKRLRSLLQLSHVTGRIIRQIGTVIFALERLPRATPGVAVALSVVYRFNHESTGFDLFLSESEFRLGISGNAYDPAVGSDSYSRTIFEMETSGFRDGVADSYEVADWLNQFDELLNLGGRVEIDYFGDDNKVDWSAEDIAENEAS